MRIHAVASLVVALAGCGTTLVNSSMPNPAKTTDKLSASQEYDIGPFKENHRYRLTVSDWTPTSLGLQVKIVDMGRCAHADSYFFTLVDDQGKRSNFKPAGPPVAGTEKGRQDATLESSTLSGAFDGSVAADAKFFTVQMRPVPNVDCPALDFRWDLK